MRPLGSEAIHELLAAVGDHLAAAGHTVGLVVVGGSSLATQGWVDRVTDDVDVIAQAAWSDGERVLVAPDPLPPALVEAVARVARDYALDPEWLNTAVGKQWEYGLPPGFEEEITWIRLGGLEVGFAGRRGLIALKLFAAVDQGPESVHAQDLRALLPTSKELSEAAFWVATQDASAAFAEELAQVADHVRKSNP